MYTYVSAALQNDISSFCDIVVWKNDFAYKILSVLYADPIMMLARTHLWASVGSVVKPSFRDRSVFHLRPVQRNNYLAGLRIITDLRRRRSREDISFNSPSWNRRRSLTISGSNSSRSEQFLYERATPNWTLPGDLSTSAQNKVRSTANMPKIGGGTTRFMYFSDLVLFARRLLPRVGSTFHRPGNLGTYTTHVLTRLEVSDDCISYSLTNIFAQLYPSIRQMSCTGINVTIRRSFEGTAPVTEVVLEGLSNAMAIKNGSPYLVEPTFFPEYCQSYDRLNWPPDLQSEAKLDLQLERFARFFRIDYLRGALYHTQGRALGRVAIDLDRNFENIVEAPGFIDNLTSLANDSDDNVKRFLSDSVPLGERIRSVSSLLSGTVLAWAFGIKPAIDAIAAAAAGYVQPLKGEGEINFEVASLSELPAGLRDMLSEALIFAFKTDVITTARLKFRTEVWTTPSYQNFVQTLYNENLIFQTGAFPTPKGVWDATAFSFVIDWVLPIGSYLDDHFNYFTSFSIPFRIGHSVRFDIQLADGRDINLFLRSSEVNYPLDPPSESWLNAPGLPTISIPLSISIAMGLVGR